MRADTFAGERWRIAASRELYAVANVKGFLLLLPIA